MTRCWSGCGWLSKRTDETALVCPERSYRALEDPEGTHQHYIKMASIQKTIVVEASPEQVWAAVRDVGAVHRRLVPGLVVDVVMDGDARMVTFANGKTVRELIIDIDDSTCRFAYSAVGGLASHHNSSIQVFVEEDRFTRLVWTTDVMPHEVADPIKALVEQGAAIMKQTLESKTAGENGNLTAD